MKILNIFNYKIVKTKGYKSIFNKKTGYFVSETLDVFETYPELMEIEITRNGCPHQCKFCYRQNKNIRPTNMSYYDFVTIVEKLPTTISQIAIGITTLKANNDLLNMLKYLKQKHISANLTMTGIDLDDETIGLIKYLSSTGISVYKNKEYLAINTLNKIRRKYSKVQVGMQIILLEENKEMIWNILHNKNVINKLSNIIFMTPKPILNQKLTLLDVSDIREILKYCTKNNITIGFDQCSKPLLKKVMSEESHKNIDNCECTFYTGFIDVDGYYHHCGYHEICGNKLHQPINVMKCNNFMYDVWKNNELVLLRKDLIRNTHNGIRLCPLFGKLC